MSAVLRKYATPFITGLFLVSLLSGVALFFHWGPGAFRGIHEVLSMVLIAPFALHAWKHWRSLATYVRHRPMGVTLAVSALLCLPFFLIPRPAHEEDAASPPFQATVRLLTHATPAQVSALVGTSADQVVAVLKQAGFASASADRTLTSIARLAGKDDGAIVASLASIAPE